MKIAKIGDIHFGIRQGSEIYQENIKLFFKNVFFPALKQYGVTRVLQTGDMFDTRKQTHSQALYNAKDCFFDELLYEHIDMDMILGNHDIYYRESLEINTPNLVLDEYKNIKVHDRPQTISIDGVAIDMIPWICEQNYSDVFDFINKSKSEYCMAHLELAGFEMSKGHMCEHGMDASLFKRYKQVWSGHFHRQSKSGNIHYLGSPSQHTFDDVGDIRGFYIFDTETHEDIFIPNPYNLFERIEYDEDAVFKLHDISNKYVKVIINNAKDSKKLEKYIESLWIQNPVDIKTVDNMVLAESAEYDITMEALEQGSFEIVPFLTEYTVNLNESLTDYQKQLVSDTYKLLYTMSKEEE
jgi:DNA repair exonuclease SbcCD nuclease subunit